MMRTRTPFVPEFAGLPGATVSFHPRPPPPLRTVELIRASGARAGSCWTRPCRSRARGTSCPPL